MPNLNDHVFKVKRNQVLIVTFWTSDKYTYIPVNSSFRIEAIKFADLFALGWLLI